MSLRADQIFVFAGAGISAAMPSGLPTFNELRDEILAQLGLASYVGSASMVSDRRLAVAAGLAPEPFMLTLTQTGIAVEDWLSDVLRPGRPNAVHQAIAQLAGAGARVWTVNFDTLIEAAVGGRLESIAWPGDPRPGAPVMKPHGTVGGRLIVTARQVLSPLGSEWRERLAADVAGRLVVFVGYSGRDLDLLPVWDDVLTSARHVLWFDKWSGSRPLDEIRKRNLLPNVDRLGLLSFPRPAPPPGGVRSGAPPSPSWDFVAWCQAMGFAVIGRPAAQALFDVPPRAILPPLPGRTEWARPAIQGLLGDYLGERRSYLQLAWRSTDRRQAIRCVGISLINHGGNMTAAALVSAAVLPPLGRLSQWREWAKRKRVTAWSRTARYNAVLRATRQLPEQAVSTGLILRSQALRITGSLDEAASTAESARLKALVERHPVRIANAAFQKCLALLWAERLNEARRCLAADFEPFAAVAANRWVAWADFIAGALAVRAAGYGDRDNIEALYRLQLSQDRFRSEALVDGVVSVMTARLSAYRLAGDQDLFIRELTALRDINSQRDRGERYYTSRNTFTVESLVIERAEFARIHQHNLDSAWQWYERVAASRYPLHAALGHLGLGLVEAERGEYPHHAETAREIGERVGCQLVVNRAQNLTGLVADRDFREVFFC